MPSYTVHNLMPGELCVSREPSLLTTLLGSCVCVTVHNKEQRYGGMNHYMLPYELEQRSQGEKDYRFGNLSIRALIDQMLQWDPTPEHLDVKLFGGGEVISALQGSRIGSKNVEAARSILDEYGLDVSAEYVEQKVGLKIRFDTYHNRVEVRELSRDQFSRGSSSCEQSMRAISERESKVVRLLRGQTTEGINLMNGSDSPFRP